MINTLNNTEGLELLNLAIISCADTQDNGSTTMTLDPIDSNQEQGINPEINTKKCNSQSDNLTDL